MTPLFSALQQQILQPQWLDGHGGTQDLCRMKIYQTTFKMLFCQISTYNIKSHANASSTTSHLSVNLHFIDHFLLTCLIPSTTLLSSFL